MSPRIILDLCGGTGSWSRPYRLDEAYDVRIVTLPDHDVRTYEPPPGVYGILAAPPCTHFSLARTTAKTPRDLDGGFEIVEACLRIIWKCSLEGTLQFWALENPVGYLRQFLGLPAFTFNPYDFGDPWTKPTDLWGYYTKPEYRYCRPEFGLDEAYKLLAATAKEIAPGARLDSSGILAVTPQGFARAFFKANR